MESNVYNLKLFKSWLILWRINILESLKKRFWVTLSCIPITNNDFSRSARPDELHVIHDLFPGEISSHIPISVTGVRHQIEDLIISVYKARRFTEAWPEGWNMVTYPLHILILYAATYGIKCLQSQTFQIMVDTVKNQYSRKFKETCLSNVKLYVSVDQLDLMNSMLFMICFLGKSHHTYP